MLLLSYTKSKIVRRKKYESSAINTEPNFTKLAFHYPIIPSSEKVRVMDLPGHNQEFSKGWARIPFPNFGKCGTPNANPSPDSKTCALIYTCLDIVLVSCFAVFPSFSFLSAEVTGNVHRIRSSMCILGKYKASNPLLGRKDCSREWGIVFPVSPEVHSE